MMAWTYGFFNSVNGDRLYNAEQMSKLFEGLITNGVYETVANKLAVQVNGGMNIQIATGRGFFSGHWVNNDAVYPMEVEASDQVLNRYCAVCIKVDSTNAVRSAVPYLKYSDFATAPTKPTMERSESINEYCLAYVYIPAKATEITAANIEDTRFNKELCGWVTGLIDQVDTTTLYEQWAAVFNDFMTVNVDDFNAWINSMQTNFSTWFENLQVQLDGDVATRLTNALPTNITVTLSSSRWLDKAQSVEIFGMTDTKSVIVQANSETAESYTEAGIKCTGQASGLLTFACETVPTVDINVNIVYMGV